jgi:hypothetical protein
LHTDAFPAVESATQLVESVEQETQLHNQQSIPKHHAPGRPALDPVLMDVVTTALDNALTSFRAQIQQDIQNMHVDMLRAFELQKRELMDVVQQSMHQAVGELASQVEWAGRQPNSSMLHLFDHLISSDPWDHQDQ